jgi:DNA-binding response OmpR family regulator
MAKVLLIDDDRKHSELMQAYFKRYGINLVCAYDSVEGFKKLAREEPDLLLLDVMLPGKDGFEICREIRKTSNIPIIMLTARGDVIDRVSGLELGADDYIGKPFEPRELVARIQGIIKRAQINRSRTNSASDEKMDAVLRFETLCIDTVKRHVTMDDKTLPLSSLEYQLLLLFATSPQKTFTRDELLNKLKGIDADIYTRSIDVLVSRLRQKLKPLELIRTIRGSGYVFVGQST